jgi:hypothetical protein
VQFDHPFDSTVKGGAALPTTFAYDQVTIRLQAET